MRISSRLLSLVVSCIGLLCMFANAGSALSENKPAPVVSDKALRQMIGQMVLVGFVGDGPNDEGYQTVLRQARDGEITGVIYLKRNIRTELAVKDLNDQLERATRGTLLIALDQEGGHIQRLTPDIGFMTTPGASDIAKTMTETGAYEVYSALAENLADLGFNVNLGPVVDLNINSSNPIIGSIGRSYSADPQQVIRYATAFIQGHRVKHVLTALKHFPGHGSSVTDSHDGATDVTDTWHEAELAPYQALIAMGDVDMVMSSHVINRRLSKSNEPSSLSHQTLTKLLKHDLKFDGVVITDDMQMNAITATRSLDEAVIQAVMAGNDILVFSNDKHPDPQIPQKVADILIAESHKNPETLARITDAYGRVMSLKKRLIYADMKVDPIKTKSIAANNLTILSNARLASYPPHPALTIEK